MRETLGRLAGGVLRFLCLFLLALVIGHKVAPKAMIELQRPDIGVRLEAGEGHASPRRPERGDAETGPGGVLFEISDPKPGSSLGTAFKVGGGTLWLTANHVISRCDTVGLDMGLFYAASVTPGRSIPESDIAALHLPAHVPQSLALAQAPPKRGDAGYHMGFPKGRRAVVVSRYMGEAEAAIGSRKRSPVLMWVQTQRVPKFRGSLAGISGGPVLDQNGALVGVNIAVSQRRGRILTAPPEAIADLLVAENAVTFSTASGQAAYPLTRLTPRRAALAARALERAGTLRRVYCRVG